MLLGGIEAGGPSSSRRRTTDGHILEREEIATETPEDTIANVGEFFQRHPLSNRHCLLRPVDLNPSSPHSAHTMARNFGDNVLCRAQSRHTGQIVRFGGIMRTSTSTPWRTVVGRGPRLDTNSFTDRGTG